MTARVPVCLPCWRMKFSMTIEPPCDLPHQWHEALCSLCGRRTTFDLWLPEAAVMHLRAGSKPG